MKSTLRSGFTLIEFVAALLAVGVIATLTIPPVVGKYQEKIQKNTARKMYTDLNDIIELVKRKNDGKVWDMSSNDTGTNTTNMTNLFKTMFPGSGVPQAITTVFPAEYNYYKSTQSIIPTNNVVNNAVILSNGVIMQFESYSDCNGVINSVNTNACGNISIDVNGKQSPNMYGMDYFVFRVVRNRDEYNNVSYDLVPAGGISDGTGCVANATSAADSEGCTNRLISNLTMP